jgi:hypothetical protein
MSDSIVIRDWRCDVAVSDHVGHDAIAALAQPLRAAGLLPTCKLTMDPEYLADGHEGEVPQAVVACSGDAPIAYLPFVVRRSHLAIRVARRRAIPLPYRQLQVFGYQAAPDVSPGLAARLLRRAAAIAGGYHLGTVAEMRVGSPLADCMLGWQCRKAGDPRVRCTSYDSFRVGIAGTFEEYLRARFSAKGRYNLRRNARRLASNCNRLETRLFSNEDVVHEFLRNAGGLAKRTYQWTQGLPVVEPTAAAASRLRHLARRGLWRAYILYADGVPCAYAQGTLYHRIYDYDVVGFDDRYAGFSPGTVLLHSILEDLFTSQVADELDFGAGLADYKRQFATRNERVIYGKMYSPRAYTSVLSGLETGSIAIVAAAKFALRRSKLLRDRGSARTAEAN